MALLFDVASKASILKKKKEKPKWYEHDIWRNPLVVAGLVQPLARQISGTLDAALNRPREQAEAAWNASNGVASSNRRINNALTHSQIFAEEEALRIKRNLTVKEFEDEKLRKNWITRGRRVLANLDPTEINPKTGKPYVFDPDTMLSDNAVFSFFNTYQKEDPNKLSPYEQQLATKVELRNKLIKEQGDLTTPEHYATILAHHSPVAKTLPGHWWNVLSNDRPTRYAAAIKNLENSPALKNVGEFNEAVKAYNEGNLSPEDVFTLENRIDHRQTLMNALKPEFREQLTHSQEIVVQKNDVVTYEVITIYNPRTQKKEETRKETKRISYDELKSKDSRDADLLSKTTKIHSLVNVLGLSPSSEADFYTDVEKLLPEGVNIATVDYDQYRLITNHLFKNFATEYRMKEEFSDFQKEGLISAANIMQGTQLGRDLIYKAYTPIEEQHPNWDNMTEEVRRGHIRNQMNARQELVAAQMNSQQQYSNMVVISSGVGYMPQGSLTALPLHNAIGSTQDNPIHLPGSKREQAVAAWVDFNRVRNEFFGFTP